MMLTPGLERHLAFEDIKKALRGSRSERSSSGELRGHLRETCTKPGPGVHNEFHALGARQGRANESVRRLEKMIRFQTASGSSKVMHA
jgi:hypothetical protein